MAKADFQITLQGGGQRDDATRGEQQGGSAHAGMRDDLDDSEIPF